MKKIEKNTIKEGIVIAIPFDNYQVAAKIIWVSSYLKNVFGFVILPGLFEDTPEVIEGDYKTFELWSGATTVLYSYIDSILDGEWTIIGDLKISEMDIELKNHNIAGWLYNGDKKIRILTPEEKKTKKYPKVLSGGKDAIEEDFRMIFEKEKLLKKSHGAIEQLLIEGHNELLDLIKDERNTLQEWLSAIKGLERRLKPPFL